jgi:hypothetical protein
VAQPDEQVAEVLRHAAAQGRISFDELDDPHSGRTWRCGRSVGGACW